MDRTQVAAKIKAIFQDVSDVTIEDENLSIVESGIDSLSAVEAFMKIEEDEDLGINIPDDVAGNFKTVGELIDYVAARVK